MSPVTDDPNDPRLHRGVDAEPTCQHDAYLVLSEDERAKGFVRPVRNTYSHNVCGHHTTMNGPLSETYARDPKFYGATFCVHCKLHAPVSEFVWVPDGQAVGS